MMPVAVGNMFEKDWYQEINGDGSIVFSASGKSFTASSSLQVDDGMGGVENRAYLRNFIQTRGGERITVRVMCRVTSGTGAIAIDYPNGGTPKAFKILSQTDHSQWMEHMVTCEVGEEIIQQDDSISIVVGSTLSIEGTIEVSRITIDIEGGANGALRTHAHGLVDITKAGGVISYDVDTNRVNAGVLSLATSGTDLLITTPPVNDTEGTGKWFQPLVFTQVSSTDKYGVTAYPSKFDPTTGSFLVQFSNGTGLLDLTGADLSDGQTLSLSFEVKMV